LEVVGTSVMVLFFINVHNLRNFEV
jgi:hypothetical protein